MKIIKRFKSLLYSTAGDIVKTRDSILGDRNYEKLIIVTRSRTGSNLLISLLNSHPDVEAKGEIFGSLNGMSCKKIWDSFFVKKRKSLKYLGFKIFYYHPMDSEDNDVWNFIKSDENIRIIHLTRKNILRTVVSKQIANKTNLWTNKSNADLKINEKQVTIDVKECINEIKETQINILDFRKMYSRELFLECSYEDLTSNREDTMKNIFNFLDLDNVKVKSNYKKQNSEKLHELILNYEELKKGLDNSDYSHYLS